MGDNQQVGLYTDIENIHQIGSDTSKTPSSNQVYVVPINQPYAPGNVIDVVYANTGSGFHSGGGSSTNTNTGTTTTTGQSIASQTVGTTGLTQPQYAAYIKELGGVYTSTGQFYSTSNPNFMPQGFTRAFGDYNPNLNTVSIVPYDKISNTVSYQGLPAQAISLPAGEKIVRDSEGKPVSVSSELFKESVPIEQYNEKITRLNEVLPLVEYYNPETEKTYSESQNVKVGNVELTSTPVKVFVNPKTGETITDIQKYIQENNIPIAPPKISYSFEESKNLITKLPVYESNNIPDIYKSESQVRMDYEAIHGNASPFIFTNLGTPLKTNSFKDFVNSYFENIRTSSSQNAINIALTVTGYKAISLATKGWMKALGVGSVYLSGPLTQVYSSIFDIIPNETLIGQAVKGGVLGVSTHLFPPIGIAYASEVGKGIFTNPIATATSIGKYVWEKPVEVISMVAAGGLRFEVNPAKFDLANLKFKGDVPQFLSLGKDIKADLKIEDAVKFGEKQFKVSYEVPKTAKAIYTLAIDKFILKNYRDIVTDVTGETRIKDVSGGGGTFDIGLIPEEGTVPNINPDLLTGIEIVPRESPELILQNEFQQAVVNAVRVNNDVITGSFAGQILFDSTRKPGDIDIASYDPLRTAKLIKKYLEEKPIKSDINDVELIIEREGIVKLSPHKVNGIDVVAVEDIYGNKADIVSIKGYSSVRKFFGRNSPDALSVLDTEGLGFLRKHFAFGGLKTVEVNGVNILRPEDLLYKKFDVLKNLGLENEKTAKTIQDIKDYTKGGIDIDVNKATLTGPYKFTKEEFESYIGKTITVTHSSTGLFGLFKKEVSLEMPKESGGFEVFFGTPADIKTGMAMTRLTRLGIATWKDILKGKYTTKKTASSPQVVVFEEQVIGLNKNPIQYGNKFNVIEKSSELEVGLPVESSPGVPNIIRKVKSGGVTLISGNRVNIDIAEVVKADSILDKQTVEQVNKASKGELSQKETESLKKKLYEETGIDYSTDTRPYFDLNRIYFKAIAASQKQVSENMDSVISSVRKTLSSGKSSVMEESTSPSNKVSSQSSIKSTISKISSDISKTFSSMSIPSMESVSVSSKPSQSSKPSIPSSPSYPSFPGLSNTPISPILKYREEKPKKEIPSLGQGYNVYIKKVNSKNFTKINDLPLTRERAKDVAQYALDTSLARTTKIKKSGQAQEDFQFIFVPVGYYNQRSYTSREYRIRKGQPIVMDDEIIKKSKYLLDTSVEKEQIQRAKEIRQQQKAILG